jgi:hypothetical protein
MSIDWWWCEGPMYRRPPQRDPREDDPDYYKDWSGRWVKRTEWSVENYETLSDWDTYCRFIQETTPAERARLKHAYLTSKGLVQWARFPETWTTPERVKELEARYQEGLKRDRENQAKIREWSRYDRLWHWC